MPGGLGSSFQWFMGIIGGSTRANRPNRRCRSGHLLGSTCGIIEKNMGGRLLGHGRLIGIIRYMIDDDPSLVSILTVIKSRLL